MPFCAQTQVAALRGRARILGIFLRELREIGAGLGLVGQLLRLLLRGRVIQTVGRGDQDVRALRCSGDSKRSFTCSK